MKKKLLFLPVWIASLAVASALPSYDVKSFGAVGDGITPATASIQKAVDRCAADGGGLVIVPAGRYLVAPLFLKSHVQFELQSGAVLLASTNFSDYPVIEGRWEGVERKILASVLNGRNLDQVSITGSGVIEGQGAVWWEANRQTLALRKQRGIKGREPENPPDAPLPWPRPRMINLYNCTNILIRDVTLRDSPSWNVHPVYCEDITIDNVKIVAPADSPNTDALDPDSCKNVRISNCSFDVGDDCVVLKSGYNEDGRRVGIPCENILVSNCLFAHGHGGVVIGSEMSGSVRNVTVINCIFDGTQTGLRVKTALGRGGVVENFRASNLVMRNILNAALSITAAYSDGVSGGKAATAPEAVPVMRNIHWSNISVDKAKILADLSGLEESPAKDISLRNIQATGLKTGIRCQNVASLTLADIELQAAGGPAVQLRQASGIDLRGLSVPEPNKGTPVVSCQGVSGLLLRDCRVAAGSGLFLRLEGKDNQNVSCEANRLASGIAEREP